ncbi:MAG TPA: NAD(P)H-binding protein [Gemmatimonadales bacterium]
MDVHALVVGATGLVGRELTRQLMSAPDVSGVTVLSRRPLPGRDNSPRLTVHLADFNHLEEDAAVVRGDWVFCALGTTIKSAGTREAFRRVDYELPLAVARIAVANGTRHFLLVSSTGASARSRIFYNRVKGELETALFELPFRSITVARPSFLLGERHEFRPGEIVGKTLGRVLPRRYRSVPARKVAAALVAAARGGHPGVRILENADLLATEEP